MILKKLFSVLFPKQKMEYRWNSYILLPSDVLLIAEKDTTDKYSTAISRSFSRRYVFIGFNLGKYMNFGENQTILSSWTVQKQKITYVFIMHLKCKIITWACAGTAPKALITYHCFMAVPIVPWYTLGYGVLNEYWYNPHKRVFEKAYLLRISVSCFKKIRRTIDVILR